MKAMRLLFVLLGSVVALGSTACGGGSSVPDGVVAVVNGTQIPQSALDEMINREKAVYATQRQAFPKEGTKDYRNIQKNYVVYLVQQAEFQQEAKKLGVTVSQKDVDDALAKLIATNYKGSHAKFRRYLKEQGFTLATFKQTLRASVLTQKLLAAATKNVKVDDHEVIAYYKLNRSSKYANTPLERARDSIYATLLDQKRGEANIAWIQSVSNRYEDKIDYAKGFEPPGS